MPRRPTGTDDADLKRPVTRDAVARLLRLAIPYRGPLAVAGLLALVGDAITLAVPLAVRAGTEAVLKTRDVASVDRGAVALLGLVMLGAGFGYAQFLVAAGVGNRIVNELRARVYGRLLRLPTAYFDRTRSGDLASLLSNDVALLQTSLTDDLVKFVGQILLLIGGVGVALYIRWELTLIVVAMLAVGVGFFVVTGRALRVITREGLDALAETTGGMTEALGNVRLVKAFAREGWEGGRAAKGLDRVLAIALRSARWEGLMGVVGAVGFTAVLVGVAWYGGRGVLAGTLRVGDILGFLAAVFVIAGPMGALASLYTRLQRAVGAAERIFGILDEPAEPDDAPDAGPFPDGGGRVEFRDVSFRYVPEVPVLRGVSLTLEPGTTTAVVGPSGAGKSTVASLLFRLYEPTEGAILVDGVPLSRIRRADLRGAVGLVPQETLLFNGTLRENIRYGRTDATDAEIEDAARRANVDEFVRALPGGYETVLGERGVTLSGGQRQRVAIARVLLKNPRILVLDEATSALDTHSEALVKEALDRASEGRTTLVIAHRLTTVRDADRVVVIEGGEVAESGGYADLAGSGGAFARLLAASSSD